MRKSEIQQKITREIQHLISKSCNQKKLTKEYKELHIALLKKYYNAANVKIDYRRKRIAMEVIIDEKDYRPDAININIPTLHTNMRFDNLKKFLRARLDFDPKSLGFYASLVKTFTWKEPAPTMA